MKYPNMTWSRMQAVIDKLGGEDGVDRFLRNELVVKAVERSFSVWKTVIIGAKSVEYYRKALKAGGYKVSYWANDILKKISDDAEKTYAEATLDLVVVSVAELGFKNGANLKQIYDRAKELGLELCPAEVGPALRLAYQDQPYGEWLRIAMEPITGSDGRLRVFSVGRSSGERWLSTRWYDPDDVWDPVNRWVFVRKS